MLCLLVVVVIGAGVVYLWSRSQHAPTVHRPPAQQPVFKPVVGDFSGSDDDDPEVTVQQGLVPGFQFKVGGYTLSGSVDDAQSGQPVAGAVVWIDLPPQKGQRTSVSLHTVTDTQGNYQFVHLAIDSYTLVASRYYDEGDGHFYAERVFPSVMLSGNRANLKLSLTPIPIPGKRTVATGQAKNVIMIDLRGFYAASLLSDPLLLSQTQNLRAFLRQSDVAQSVLLPYGWRPLDQYALLTGSYPQWATYDPWPNVVPWGEPDAIDTTFWLTGGRSTHLFGQESIFDVAKSYGMQTNVVAGGDYILSDSTTRSLDLLQQSSSFDANRWLTQTEDAVSQGEQQANGFMLYAELASLAPGSANSSPDAQGDDYQQALLRADQTFGQFLTWLGQEGLLHNTLIVLTTSQAQANHTDADNFYGMGTTGQGSSKETFLALSGPGICAGSVDNTPYSAFGVAPTIMHELGLPAPAEARIAIPFAERRCG